MRLLKIVALAAIAIAMTAPAFAQTSPTNLATAGVFTTNVEDSMNVHDYGNVEFGKAAGFAGYANSGASLGYAFKPGGLYLGLWYNGRVASKGSTLYEDVTTTYNLTNQVPTQTVTITSFTNDYVETDNRVNALLGIKGMGIKIGFYETLTIYNHPDGTITVTEPYNSSTVTYTGNEIVDYSRVSGWMIPSVGWGMTIGKIKPYADISFGIYQNNTKYNYRQNPIKVNGEISGVDTVTSQVSISDYLQPSATVGAYYELSAATTLGLSYGFRMNIYNNDYDIAGIKGTAKGTFTNGTGSVQTTETYSSITTVRTGNLTINEQTNFRHSITPSYRYEKTAGEGLTIGFLAAIPVTITSTTSENKVKNTTTTKYEEKNDALAANNYTREVVTTRTSGLTDTTQLQIIPRIRFGAMYQATSKFAVNAGIQFSPFSWTNSTANFSRATNTNTDTTVTTLKDGNGNEIDRTVTNTAVTNGTDTVNDRQTITDTWGWASIGAGAGFTLKFSDNLALDASLNTSATPTSFSLDLTNIAIMFTFKY